MNIAVYCSSKNDLDRHYVDMARALGHWIGENGHTLVYGGVDAGLMHFLAKAVKEAGGQVVGVVPDNFARMADRLVDRLITTDNLNARKAHMYLISDLHVVLPGGVGTIDEWMSALSQMVVDKRSDIGVVVANVNGLFDRMLNQLEQLALTPFAGERHLEIMRVVCDTEHLIRTLNEITSLNPINVKHYQNEE